MFIIAVVNLFAAKLQRHVPPSVAIDRIVGATVSFCQILASCATVYSYYSGSFNPDFYFYLFIFLGGGGTRSSGPRFNDYLFKGSWSCF